MNCSMCSGKNKAKATHVLTQAQGRRLEPCKPIYTCDKHTPNWARIGIPNPLYKVEVTPK